MRALLDRFNELSMNYSEETADEFGRVQERIDAVDGWNLDTTLEIAMDALRCPPADADVSTLSGGERRRVALCRLLLEPAGPAAARRADQPPRRRVGGLARAPPARLPGHGRRRHPRSLLPGQRRRLDPRARPRPRDPLPGQLLGLARAEARSGSRRRRRQESARQRTIERELEWVRLNASARRNKPKARLNAYEALLAEDRNVKLDQVQIHIPAGPRLGDVVVEADGLRKALRRPGADRRPQLQPPARRDRRRDRPQRRRQDDADADDHRRRSSPTQGSIRLGETRRARVRRPVARRARPRQDRLGGDLGRAGPDHARRAHRQQPRVRRPASTSRAPTSRRRSASSPAASATGCTWRSCCAPAATCCCSTSRPTTSTSTRCGRSRRRCWRSRAARWSSPTTAGSSTGSRPTCWRSRATRRCAGSRATSRPTRASGASSSAPRPTARTGSRTRSWCVARCALPLLVSCLGGARLRPSDAGQRHPRERRATAAMARCPVRSSRGRPRARPVRTAR